MTETQRDNCWDWHCSFMTEKIECFACRTKMIYRKGENQHGWGCTLIIRNGIRIPPNVVPICKSCTTQQKGKDLLDFMLEKKKTITKEQAQFIRDNLKNSFHTYIDNNDI
jgi:hypothetical protein